MERFRSRGVRRAPALLAAAGVALSVCALAAPAQAAAAPVVAHHGHGFGGDTVLTTAVISPASLSALRPTGTVTIAKAASASTEAQLPGTTRDALTDPQMIANADGRLEVFESGGGGAIDHAWQTVPGGTWSSWSRLGGRDKFVSFSTVRTRDGRLEVFAVDRNLRLQHSWQTTPGGSWSPFENLGNGGYALYGLVAAVNADGRVEVLSVTTDHRLVDIHEDRPGGPWSPWSDLSGPSAIVGPPGIALDKLGRLNIVAIAPDQHVLRAYQAPTASGWSGWFGMNSPRMASNPAVGAGADGLLEVFALDTTGKLQKAVQKADFSFGAWSRLPGIAYLVGDPVIGVNADGRLEVFVLGSGRDVHHIWQVTPHGSWSGWASLGGPFASSLSAALNTDGKLGLVALGATGETYYNLQNSTPYWTGWRPLV